MEQHLSSGENEKQALIDLLFEHCVRYQRDTIYILTELEKKLLEGGYQNLIGADKYRVIAIDGSGLERNCPECGNDYYPKAVDQKYCSRACSNKVSGRRQKEAMRLYYAQYPLDGEVK